MGLAGDARNAARRWRGTISELRQVVEINYVLPRVLDLAQIGALNARLIEWTAQLGATADVSAAVPAELKDTFATEESEPLACNCRV